ncbi:DNA polymerase III subunit delta' [uncultured Ferrimonas sp.]|uniref:DNA polymerase III subunit delta' n=1 Tax=uncultured Ferrimonas sp. TaxID=432640 RepID=UPI00262337CB|nr:DNA polymerase III subunit delta' [uncultured Ferrimonas sp.]
MISRAPWLSQPWQQWQQRQQSGRLGHALLLQGPEGTGKQLLAEKILAQLLCDSQSHCGMCKSCQLLKSGNHPDRIDIHPDGTQIKVEAIRGLITQLESTAHQGGARVITLHQVERLNGAAANALLKTLEEPMPGVYLLLLCSAPEKLLPTITSRCQKLLVPMPSWQQTADYLGPQAQTLGSWPYWQALLGGPFELEKWLKKEDVNQVTQWRKSWRASLKSGLLEPQLAAVSAEQAPMVLKVLYFELLFIGRSRPQWLASNYHSVQLVSEKIAWLQRQTGINLTAVLQQLITEIRQHAG